MGRKKTEGDFRQVGFRMPREAFDLLAQVADARGIDLSALLNTLVAESLPAMRAWLADRAHLEVAAGAEAVYYRLLPPERREAVRAHVERFSREGDLRAAIEAWSQTADGSEMAIDVLAIFQIRSIHERARKRHEQWREGEAEGPQASGQG